MFDYEKENKMTNKEILKNYTLVFDVESWGLYGDAFAYGYVLLDKREKKLIVEFRF